MTDDINAAAERLRRAKIPGEKPYYDIVKPPGDAASMHYAKIDDLKLLANAYIAEHDPGKVTAEWLIECGLSVRDYEPKMVRCEIGITSDLCLRLNFDGDADESFISGNWLWVSVKTRGDVRSLCRVLGIQIEQTKGGE